METITLPFTLNGISTPVTIDVGDADPAERAQGAIAFYTSKGFAIGPSSAGPVHDRLGAPAPQAAPAQQAGCPHHGSQKLGSYNGKAECKFIADQRPNWPFNDRNNQGYTFLGKSDGQPKYACSWRQR